MKKTILGMALFSTLLLANGTLSYAASTKEEIKVTQTQMIRNDIDKAFSVEQKKVTINDTGKMEIKTIFGTVLEGEFEEEKNDFIDLKADGTFKAIKVGKTKMAPVFNLTDKSFKELKEAVEKNIGVEAAKSIKQKIQMKEFSIEVLDKEQVKVPVTFDYTLSNDLVSGNSSYITIKPIYGVAVEGKFKAFKSDTIELKEDGELIALKTGEEKLDLEFKLSEKSEKAIKEAYIKENKKANLNIDDITLIEETKTKPFSVNVLENKKEETEDTTQSTSNSDTSSTSETTEETNSSSETGESTTETVETKVGVHITTEISFNKENFKVDEVGALTLKPIYGVTPKGQFKAINNGIVKLEANGKLTGLKAGKTSIKPEFTISEASKKEIKQGYIKESKRKDLKEEDIDLIINSQTTDISINVEKKTEPKVKKIQVDITPTFKTNNTQMKVGAIGGKVSVAPIQGVEVKGKFKPVKDSMFEMKEDGSFVGLKAGRVELVPSFEISKESLDAIANQVLKQKGNEGRKRSDIEFVNKDIAQVVKLEFTSTNNNNNNSNNNSGKQYVPVKKYEPVKTLPQTGEKAGIFLTLIGSLTAIGSVVLLKFRTK